MVTPFTGSPARSRRRRQVHRPRPAQTDRKSTRLNSSHSQISYAVFCLKKKKRHSIRQCLVRQKLYIASSIHLLGSTTYLIQSIRTVTVYIISDMPELEPLHCHCACSLH